MSGLGEASTAVADVGDVDEALRYLAVDDPEDSDDRAAPAGIRLRQGRAQVWIEGQGAKALCDIGVQRLSAGCEILLRLGKEKDLQRRALRFLR